MTLCKFVDGKGEILAKTNIKRPPCVGEHVQLITGDQYRVIRVMTVYETLGQWILVTLGAESW